MRNAAAAAVCCFRASSRSPLARYTRASVSRYDPLLPVRSNERAGIAERLVEVALGIGHQPGELVARLGGDFVVAVVADLFAELMEFFLDQLANLGASSRPRRRAGGNIR